MQAEQEPSVEIAESPVPGSFDDSDAWPGLYDHSTQLTTLSSRAHTLYWPVCHYLPAQVVASQS